MKKVILGVVALVAILGAVSYQGDKPLDELKAKYGAAPSTYMDVLGMSVHVRDEGPRNDPMPIVLIHGTGSSLHTFEGWAEALRTERRVIRFDIPGFGLTGPHPEKDYRMVRYTEFVAAMLDALKVEKAIVGGNSLGGEIAWNTAVDYPNKVSALILVDAAGYPLELRDIPLGFKLAATPWLKPMVVNTLPKAVTESSVKNVYGDPSKVTPELVDRYWNLALRPGNREALGQRLAVALDVEPERVKKIQVPTLILWGAKDKLIPPVNADKFKADIPAPTELVIFPELGHVPQDEDAAQSVAPVKKWLAGLAAAAK